MKELKINGFKTKLLFVLLFSTLSIAVLTGPVAAKSLYVIADLKANPQPLHAYDIGTDGTLEFQAEYMIPHHALGAVGLAVDSDEGFLFVTYEISDQIELVNLKTMTSAGKTIADDADDLAGIVYDHEKKLLYCVDRLTSRLFAYNWDPNNAMLDPLPGSPFNLRRASAYGIALDEIDDLLYVANASNQIYVYRTSDWSMVKTITLSRVAISVALDVGRGYLYTGGGYAGNKYLTQYDLTNDIEKEVQVEPDAGVMGLGVDPASGFIYMSTGNDTISGGDNLLVFNSSLEQIDIVENIGNPTGLVVPGKDIGFNPLNLKKTVTGGVSSTDEFGVPETNAGSMVTYTIEFDNLNNESTITDVVVVDDLPFEVSFVSADEDENFGYYDSANHTYTWIYPSMLLGSKASLDLTVQVKDDVSPGTTIVNSVTINSNQTPPATAVANVATALEPLHIKKSVEGVSFGEIKYVEPGELVKYRIHFDNNENDFTATDVLVIDFLPEEVSFIKADYHGVLGHYDSKLHAYIWDYPPLDPGSATRVEITVKVNSDVVPGTVITNMAVIDSEETTESSSTVDIIVSGVVNQFNLDKSVVGAAGEIAYVAVDMPFEYNILFDTNDINTTVTNVTLVDTLPDELVFISADGEGDIGQFDVETNTFTWSYPSLSPGQTISLNLRAKVKEGVALGKTITNTVIIDSTETPQAVASASVTTDVGGIAAESLQFVPDTVRRNGALTGLIAAMILPERIKLDDLKNEPLRLFPGGLKSTYQEISVVDGKVKILAVFDKNELMDALIGYGPFELEVIGQLKSGQSFYGQALITVTRFANY